MQWFRRNRHHHTHHPHDGTDFDAHGIRRTFRDADAGTHDGTDLGSNGDRRADGDGDADSVPGSVPRRFPDIAYLQQHRLQLRRSGICDVRAVLHGG
jgi:hypothetical protein